MNREELGRKGEEKAKFYLEKQDYFIMAQNFKCKFGEIDIIAIDKNELVFVEVKTRGSKKYGEARDAVNHYKKKHIKRAANFFIYKNKLENKFVRFDVIEVYFKNNIYKINHVKNVLW